VIKTLNTKKVRKDGFILLMISDGSVHHGREGKAEQNSSYHGGWEAERDRRLRIW
jgi:hypothetical protein